MSAEPSPQRRSVLKAGAAIAVASMVEMALPAPAVAAAHPAAPAAGTASVTWPELSRRSLWYGRPATDWQREALPVGNGRLGAMLFGGPVQERVQFNEQSLWGGVNDYDNALMGEPDNAFDTSVTGFGSYRNCGDLRVAFGGTVKVTAPGGPYRDSGPGETVAQSYDGNPRTKWCIVGPPAEVLWQVSLPDPVAVGTYSLTSANDVPERDPQQWTLAGSDDGETWAVLDGRDLPAPFEERFQTKTFEVGNPTPYSHYRFTFAPKSGVSHFQMAEVGLAGIDLRGGGFVYVSSPSGHAKGDASGHAGPQSIAATVDHDDGTAWQVVHRGKDVVWQADLTTAAAVASYRITSGSGERGHDPARWTLAGSADGLTWEVLDERADETFDGNGATRSFTVDDAKTYSSYRLTLHPRADSGRLQVGGIALVGSGFDTGTATVLTDYRRALDPTAGVQVTRYAERGHRVLREVFASRDADCLVLRYRTDDPAGFSGTISLTSAQSGAPTTVDADAGRLGFAGTMANDLRFACAVRVVPAGGTLSRAGDEIGFDGCRALTLYLDARTDYAMDAAAGWRGVDPAPVVAATLAAAVRKDYGKLREQHVRRIGSVMSRANVTWGSTDQATANLPTDLRRAKYAGGGEDPELEQTMFDYGRYLLASSSRPGGLPANLQGVWNDSNEPPWASGYHTNINVQMNYWAAETTNLSETHLPLVDFVEQVAVPSRVATRNAFGADTRGWTARTSQSIFGGNAWQWNTVASAWYMQHVFEHYAFTQDREFLRSRAYPMVKEICQFWEDRLVERPDGLLVSPNGWSPEHGPHEDGVMYDQQIIWDLFSNYLEMARALDTDRDYQSRIADLRDRLAPNKVGRWGQLQEWQTDRDDPENIHRHTSHLFAVYPGRQITRAGTPDFADAALVSLKARCGEKDGVPFTAETVSGDSRRSWTWPWRCALFARLGDGHRARIMIRGLLAYNTLPNLFCDHPPFQMDGNFGLPGAVTEMLLQSHEGFLSILPACPDEWADGSFTGLRARGGYEVSARWRGGKVTSYSVVADRAPNRRKVKVRVNGRDTWVTPKRG
ncbi:glycosyl hydrolase [Streptomyces sp. WAC 06738]|uniref:glycosyl hydrolase family 95 catalytic domain-containing protein n=1 Tax=Streptomyces sp. WAC 06738 TaxID=2203210 RepID=UPI000F6D110A|nr:glycoside hydrolase N-terminal domain-containing protein [Streptomyces sp. WAC 06738]AZM48748.1 glycosyl hydrolase [Streptomyces sp. WAC 06738]